MKKQMFIFVSLVLLFAFVDANAQQTAQQTGETTMQFLHINPENGERTWKVTTMDDYVQNWRVGQQQMEILTTKFPREGSIVFKIKDDLLGKTNHFDFAQEEQFALLSKYVDLDIFNGVNVTLASEELSKMPSELNDMSDEDKADAIESLMVKVRNIGNK